MGWGGLCGVLFVCIALACAQEEDPVTTTASGSGVTISVQKTTFDFEEPIQVLVEYDDDDDKQDRVADYVGLFPQSPGMNVRLTPWTIGLPNTKTLNSTAKIVPRRSGLLDIRLIRPPLTTLAKISVVVFAACPLNCSGHGICRRGLCLCQEPYRNDACSSLDSLGLHLDLQESKGQLTDGLIVGGHITAVISHDKIAPNADLLCAADDFVGIYHLHSTNGSRPIDFRFVPRANRTVVLPLPHTVGAYVLRLVDHRESLVTAQSSVFEVTPRCPQDCMGNGKCVHGKCECNQGFDLADCSRHANMANITLSTQGDLSENSEIIATFWRDETMQVFSHSDIVVLSAINSTACLEPVLWYPAFLKHTLDPDVLKHRGNWSTGQVSFSQVDPGTYVFQYCRERHLLYAQSKEFEVFPKCRNNCSFPNGVCLRGECKCSDTWMGETCKIGIAPIIIHPPGEELYRSRSFFVEFQRPYGKGSNYDFVALYNVSSTNNSLGIVDWQYAIAARDGQQRHVLKGAVELMSSVEGNFTLRYVDAATMETRVESPPIQIFAPCPAYCSGHGTCEKGACVCESDWKAEVDCSKQSGNATLTLALPSNHITLTNTTTTVFVNVNVTHPGGTWQSGDLVGLFPAGEDKPKLLAFQYAPSQSPAWVQFRFTRAINPGKYELRYVRADKSVASVLSIVVEHV